MLLNADKREAAQFIMPHLFVPLKHSANTLFSFCIQKIQTIQMDFTEKAKHTEGKLLPPTVRPTIIGPDSSIRKSFLSRCLRVLLDVFSKSFFNIP